eukprot:GHVQ01025915.1.p1 GENE.GHVQ01025915.1~~GHVQ01025915.1.p1  ORF type:complete len:691 (+),score=145.55 GHVQ01025915.1:157-2229(+)
MRMECLRGLHMRFVLGYGNAAQPTPPHPSPPPHNTQTVGDGGEGVEEGGSVGGESRHWSSTYGSISDVKVLVVGAGGIGCELIKCLLLNGIENITVVDLDTIDVSNLNRQFLFRREHIGMAKAVVAADVVSKYNPRAKIVGMRGNVKDPEFGVEFVRGFNVVMNALDNVDARRHINRICIAYDIPLFESGSEGYNGQAYYIGPGVTGCYECFASVKPKSYAVCTIRSTPDKPEHCVAWAKYLFELLFGADDEGNVLYDLKHSLKHNGSSECSKDDKQLAAQWATNIFNQLFDTDIIKAIELPGAWEHRTPPRSMSFDQARNHKEETPVEQHTATTAVKDQKLWSMAECASKFVSSASRITLEHMKDGGIYAFSKDDDLAMDFVTAAANLRMHNFRIARKSRWDTQSIAGAIIPAIATTNAITASQQVVQLLHYLEFVRTKERTGNNKLNALHDSRIRYVWVRQFPQSNGDVIAADRIDPPNPLCFVCQQQQIHLSLHSFQEWTIRRLVTKVLKAHMAAHKPLVDLNGRCVWDPDEEDEDGQMPCVDMSLAALGIHIGDSLIVTDCSQADIQFDVMLNEDTTISEDTEPSLFVIIASRNARKGTEGHKDSKTEETSQIGEEEEEVDLIECVGGNERKDERGEGGYGGREGDVVEEMTAKRKSVGDGEEEEEEEREDEGGGIKKRKVEIIAV